MKRRYTKRYVRPRKIQDHVRQKYQQLSDIQEEILSVIGNYAAKESTRFSRRALGYLFEEVNKPENSDISSKKALEVLDEFISQMGAHKRNTNQISYAVIVRTLREYDCPKPWC
jgi:hypothetical protein